MKQRPSRILNEPSSVIGLTGEDILVLAGFFYLSQQFLLMFRLEILSLPLAAIVAVPLCLIRMKYRRKIIRDGIRYYYHRILTSGMVYVSEDN